MARDNLPNNVSFVLVKPLSSVSLFFFLEKTLMITKSSLNNIKLEILKQNRLIIDEVELVEEITKVNKMNQQDNMEKHLKINRDEDKIDRDLQQNLYLYGTKNVNYGDQAFEGGNKEKDLENGYNGKGVFSNPPKKRKSKSKKKDKNMNTGFVIDDLYNIEDISVKEDEISEQEKETNIKKSINYINKRNEKKKKKFKPKPKTEDEENKKDNKFRYYHVKEYNPDKAKGVNNFNYNMYKDSDFGFNESEGSEENKQQNNIRINSDINTLKDSTDQLQYPKNTFLISLKAPPPVLYFLRTSSMENDMESIWVILIILFEKSSPKLRSKVIFTFGVFSA
jgi:hypothetical protein